VIAGVKDPERRNQLVHEVLSAVGLDPNIVVGRLPHEFSGGQCQRICIARALIRKVSGFGFAEVVAYDPYISAEQLAEIGVRKAEKEELLRISDIISLHLHANAETNGMICKETLALMKPTAILINVSRGPLVKDEDLLDALRGHRILAAGLDTHNHEPLGAQSPFCQLDNVVLTDHTAYSTAEGVMELKTKAAQNVVDVLEGRTPRYPVNHL
jgi:D-3-phosphoglycerate dehydrogenase